MRMLFFGLLLATATHTNAQDLLVYDNALQNGFVGTYSYGGGTQLLHPTTTHNGSTFSISFTGNNSNAVAFPHETVDFNTNQYAGIRFYVHGGVAGGQQLRLQIYNNLGGVPLANVELDSFVAGGSIAANEWRLVEARFNSAPLAFSGSFDRFDLQSDAPGAQAVLYIDDVQLIAVQPNIFASGFEDGAAPNPGQLRFVNLPANLAQTVTEDAGLVTYQVERIGGSSGAVSIDLLIVAGGTATAPADFALVSATANWADTETGIRNLTLSVVDDAINEPTESATLGLGNSVGGVTITAPSSATLTINDNDPAPSPGQLRFGSATFSGAENSGSISITVERVAGSSGQASVSYASSNGTAVAPGDYTAANGSLMWADGEAGLKNFQLTVVADGVAEVDETVNLSLSNAVGASLGVPASAVVTIIEPELLFVPQYTTSSIKIYQRVAGTFSFLRTVPLGAGLAPASVLPNALAFAPDGKLWVVDNGAPGKRLLRYSQAALLNQANPVAEVVVAAVGANAGDVFDLAFFDAFAYVSQSNFGNIDRILKYPLASLAVSGSPVATNLTAASLDVPAGLEFDAQGRLWISNYSSNTLVRMNTTSAAIDKTATNVAVGARNALNLPEGLAFDADGSLWVGNNGEPTISAYASWQIDAAGFGATAPVHQIDINPALFQGDTVGGLLFDRDGDLWANYQKTLALREYSLTSFPRPGGLPGVGSYTSAAAQTLANATTFPGFGGIAIWPLPASTHLRASAFRGTNVVGMEMGYTFFDPVIGPIGGTHYPVHDTRLIDFFASKGMTTIRFLFSWEGMQSSLMGPIPAAPNGNYRLYFDRYKNIVDYATNVKGMQVIVEPWQADTNGGAGGPRWRGGLVGTAAVPMAAWQDFWTKFAGIYAGNPRVSFGLVNEPNTMSTLGWWAIAQVGIDAIRAAGASQRIFVPGNGYTAASTWVIANAFYDTDPVKRSNAYGWLNANGPGMPINDPLDKLVVEVHTYLDPFEGGSSTEITSITAAREHLAVVVNEARLRGYKVYLGELGFFANVAIAPAAWADFIAYFEANQDVLIGFTWWAGGAPGWWDDVAANGGGHFAITPTNGATFTGDTVNMDMIENDF